MSECIVINEIRDQNSQVHCPVPLAAPSPACVFFGPLSMFLTFHRQRYWILLHLPPAILFFEPESTFFLFRQRYWLLLHLPPALTNTIFFWTTGNVLDPFPTKVLVLLRIPTAFFEHCRHFNFLFDKIIGCCCISRLRLQPDPRSRTSEGTQTSIHLNTFTRAHTRAIARSHTLAHAYTHEHPHTRTATHTCACTYTHK